MILKYKYHSDSCLLEAYRSYTLAQNNSLSDTIVITSTAPDAEKYNYCLEFICYNSKSIPKTQYISPILTYNDGISFVVPNNLTEFRGHVDMQLTGYDPDDNSIVFKSVSKNCKAFDVEGSLCVLEKDLNDTPNVFTEVLKQLETLNKIHEELIDEAMNRFGKQILDSVAAYKWFKIKFYDNGKMIAEQWALKGSKLNPPKYTLPKDCVVVGGWYNPATECMWDMENDTVEGDTELYLNYMSQGVSIVEGEVRSLKVNTQEIYIPEYYEGYKVNRVYEFANVGGNDKIIHFGNNMEEFDAIITDERIARIYFPETNSLIISKDGFLYFKDSDNLILLYAPKDSFRERLIIVEGCSMILSLAIKNMPHTKHISLPKSLQILRQYSITDTSIEELIIPPNVYAVQEMAVYCNSNLKRVIFEGDAPKYISDNSFVSLDSNRDPIYPKLYVYPQYYENFKALGLAYEIQVIGQEYLDGRYAPKGE